MKVIIIILYTFATFSASKKAVPNELWNALIKINQKQLPIYSNYDKTKVSYYIKNDTLKEDYFELKVVKRHGDMFKIKFASARNENYIREGWIELKYVGVYLRPHGSSIIYPVYQQPTEKSKHHTVVNTSSELIDVTDVCGDWLKIRMKIKSRYEIGWMHRKYLCANPYSTCD